ncbi:quercetin 2,3-dioxygenase [Chroococcidiopsis cubana SAG 39.79]|jgi:quercetin 2,3-dioxygenase|uniref:Pirin domain protein n=2 Tax=Chroococcidiopsis TaxID=54298 RepID=K9U1G3_CHRTP|nr:MULTISPECIES: pirin family protein [Chroococcidiopsis]PSB49078.1 pirin family protein [Cyanosarcina cf. burmensis CCALA 770]AFY88463.1 Pirin domain protein [Chroococcidiopsis thermalis PCC 7203]PSB64164.1 pirin family protein [Chroococcidiopsis cubana CCALA 043]PSM45612.1 pirin family protein [Chroococcidiopsis sp. CCALA 051]RUT06830.1 quercetin 2,3-dioxygenase [Chroococcidiopsis cubana SAG 39.79]
MITLRQSQERGHANHGWLDSYHTFSFANYYDPSHMGFRSLRVINEDRVQPGRGFGTHGHRDMEILTYVLEGALEHKDSIGNGEIVRPGEVQRMSAGTGIMHSEFNPSATEPVHLLQIWILPDRQGLEPSYEQKAFSVAERQGKLRLIAAKDGRDGAVTIHQDVNLYSAILQPQDRVTYQLQPNRYAWLQVARGAVALNGHSLNAGDGVAIGAAELLEISSDRDAEILLFDLA